MQKVSEKPLAAPADYVSWTKEKLGDVHMSDGALGKLWGLSPSSISNARYGNMSDRLAMKIADVLGVLPGEVLWAARTARERDPITRAHLESWARTVGKMMSAVPRKAVSALAALAVALSAWFLPAPEAQAGGAGRFRH